MRSLATLAAVCAIVAGASPAPAHTPGTEGRVSIGADGQEAAGPSSAPAISADGRVVAFASDAANLVEGDTNGVTDVFVRDLEAGTTTLVSVGDGPADGPSSAPAISADGRVVAFASDAANLVEGDTNGVADVFVRDAGTGRVEAVSVDQHGGFQASPSFAPGLSQDGLVVAFPSASSTLVEGDTNGKVDVFVHDRGAGTIERVSISSEGVEGAQHSNHPGNVNVDGGPPSLSADGRHVAFWSRADNLVPVDTNGHMDIFVHDRKLRTTERVSLSSDASETAAGQWSVSPSISADARFIAFESVGTDVAGLDTNAAVDVFLHDRVDGSTRLISANPEGPAGDGGSGAPALSAGGGHIAFVSDASDLAPGDLNGVADVFLGKVFSPVGLPEVSVEIEGDTASVSGRARFSGVPIVSRVDAPDDALGAGPLAAASLGAEIVGAGIVARPERGDLWVTIRLAQLPPPPTAGGSSGVVYRIRLTTGAGTYEVRATRATLTSDPPGGPQLALYRCAPVCVAQGSLEGGLGVGGPTVAVSIPLAAIGAEAGGSVESIAVFTDLGEPAVAGGGTLDEVSLGDAVVTAGEIAIGVAPAGTPEAEVAYVAATLSGTAFTGTLDLTSLPPGDHEVWVRACVGEACVSERSAVSLS